MTTLTLDGLSVEDFGPEEQAAFVAGVAEALGVAEEKVGVDDVKPVGGGGAAVAPTILPQNVRRRLMGWQESIT